MFRRGGVDERPYRKMSMSTRHIVKGFVWLGYASVEVVYFKCNVGSRSVGGYRGNVDAGDIAMGKLLRHFLSPYDSFGN